MDFSVITVGLVTKLILLLLIGMGPKIALVPFLEKTKNFDAETQRAIGRHMVMVAVITALVMFAFGALLMRLLHITGGAVAVVVRRRGLWRATLAADLCGRRRLGADRGGQCSRRVGFHGAAAEY